MSRKSYLEEAAEWDEFDATVEPKYLSPADFDKIIEDLPHEVAPSIVDRDETRRILLHRFGELAIRHSNLLTALLATDGNGARPIVRGIEGIAKEKRRWEADVAAFGAGGHVISTSLTLQ